MGSGPHATWMTSDDDGGGPAASLTVRGASTAVSLLVVLAACSSDGAVRTGESSSLEVAAGAEGLQMLSVIGAGRASQAASATGGSTVVATSIGVNDVDASGETTVIGSVIGAPANAVAVSPDGRYAVVEG